MPAGDRIRRWRGDRRRRLIRDGDEYTIDEDNRDEIELEFPERRPGPEPPVAAQGEPWGWMKSGPRPKGWPGPNQNLDDPGPYDGSWDPPGVSR